MSTIAPPGEHAAIRVPPSPCQLVTVSPCHLASLSVSCALLLAGCGGPLNQARNYGGEDGKQIAVVISEFENFTNNAKEFQEIFTAGSAPKGAARKKYIGLQLTLVGKPTVSGETATAKVAFEKSSSGEKLGEQTWEFAKEGGTWKIKAAPLP